MKIAHFVVLIGISTAICCAPPNYFTGWNLSPVESFAQKSYHLNEEITKPVGAPFITVTHGVQIMIYRMALDVPEYLTPQTIAGPIN